jgi:hypothetical protein
VRPATLIRRVTDAVALGFGGWTLLCHAVVLAGGSLRTLVWATAPVAAGLLIVLLLRGRRDGSTTGRTADPSPPPGSSGRTPAASPRLAAEIAAATVVTLVLWYLVHDAGHIAVAWWIAVLSLVALFVHELKRPRPDVEAPAISPRTSTLVLLALVGLAVTATLWIQRPDEDDALYGGQAVSAVDQPDRPLLRLEDPTSGVPGYPLRPQDALRSLELLIAATSFLTGIPVIDIAHRAFPPLWAAVVVFAHARLFLFLAAERWLPATISVLALFLTVADTHRWYSNFAFVRLHQGKAVFLSALLPLVAAVAMECARRPTRAGWGRLFFTLVAAAGTSPTALWVAPAVAFPSLIAATDLETRRSAAGNLLRSFLWGTLVCGCLVAAGVLIRAPIKDWLSAGLAGVTSIELLRDSSNGVLGTGVLAPIVALATALAWSTCLSGPARRFCLLLPLLFLAVFANPYLAAVIAGLGPGKPTYWRTYWVLPVPVLLALCLTAPLGAWGARWPRRAREAAWIVLLMSFVLFVPRTRVLSPANRVALAFFDLKVPPDEYDMAGQVARSTPPDCPVLTPDSVAPWVVTYPRHPRPLVVRGQYVSSDSELGARRAMMAFASAPDPNPKRREWFLATIEAYAIGGVSFVTRGNGVEPLRGDLAAHGFRWRGRRASYELWTRPCPSVRSSHSEAGSAAKLTPATQ